jgi:hypothetical protein
MLASVYFDGTATATEAVRHLATLLPESGPWEVRLLTVYQKVKCPILLLEDCAGNSKLDAALAAAKGKGAA